MMVRVIWFWFAVALFSVVGADLSHANCSQLQALAQSHAIDMARRFLIHAMPPTKPSFLSSWMSEIRTPATAEAV